MRWRRVDTRARHQETLCRLVPLLVYLLQVFLFVLTPAAAEAGTDYCTKPLYTADAAELQRWTHYGDVEQTTEGNVRAQKFGPKHLWSARSEKKLSLPGQDGNLIVIKALVRGDGLVAGERVYEKAHIKAELKASDGRERVFATFMDGSFPWEYRYLVVERPAGTREVSLSVLNLAAQGDFQVQSLDVYLCSNDNIAVHDYPVSWQDAIAGKPPRDAHADLKSAIWHHLNRDLMGFDAVFLPVRLPPARDLLANPLVQAIPFTLLRFPSGITANFYHWEYDGFNSADLEQFPQMNTPGWRGEFQARRKGGLPLGLKDVVEWSKRSGVRLNLVLNVVTAKDVTETVGLVAQVQRLGGRIAFVELGNELYLKDQGGKRIPGPKAYVEAVRPVIAALRKEYPGIRIGVPFSHEHWEWNETVYKAGLDFDGIILHPYINSSSVATIGEDKMLIGYATEGLKTIFKRVTHDYPGKAIWVTEWNFEDRPLRRRVKTPIGAIYAANTFATMLETPAIDAANYFAMYGKKYGMIEVQGNSKEKFAYRTTPAYDFWKGLAPLMETSDAVAAIPVTLTESYKAHSVSGNEVRLVAFRRGNDLSYLIINNTASPLRLFLDGISQTWRNARGGVIRLGDATTSAAVSGEQMSNGFLEVQPISVTWIGPVTVASPLPGAPKAQAR